MDPEIIKVIKNKLMQWTKVLFFRILYFQNVVSMKLKSIIRYSVFNRIHFLEIENILFLSIKINIYYPDMKKMNLCI